MIIFILLVIGLNLAAKPIIEFDLNTSIYEKQLGSEFAKFIFDNNNLIKDVELHNYINTLGKKLTSLSNAAERHYDFFLFDQPSINAFAGPNGYIGIHSGLILASEYESEVAAVLAHEIAHITQNHLQRFIQKTSQNKYWLSAAILGSLLTGSNELGQAIFSSSVAVSAQQAVNFTREHEQQADQVGLELLQKTNYNPNALARFFQKLKDDPDAIEYLRTHPLSVNRIAKSLTNSNQSYHFYLDYAIVKARLFYQRFGKISNGDNKTVNTYIKAYDLHQKKQHKNALLTLKPIIKSDNVFVNILASQLYLKTNQQNKATKTITSIFNTNPNNQALAYYFADIYTKINIKTAINQLKQFHRNYPTDYYIDEKLARLYLNDGQKDKYHIYHAFALVKQEKYADALLSLTNAIAIARHQDTRQLASSYEKQIKNVINTLNTAK